MESARSSARGSGERESVKASDSSSDAPRSDPPRPQSFRPFLLWSLGPLLLAFLWFVLINHLRVEWAVNPQYSYGWAVPFLCLYLAWRTLREKSRAGNDLASGPPAADQTAEDSP